MFGINNEFSRNSASIVGRVEKERIEPQAPAKEDISTDLKSAHRAALDVQEAHGMVEHGTSQPTVFRSNPVSQDLREGTDWVAEAIKDWKKELFCCVGEGITVKTPRVFLLLDESDKSKVMRRVVEYVFARIDEKTEECFDLLISNKDVRDNGKEAVPIYVFDAIYAHEYNSIIKKMENIGMTVFYGTEKST